MKVIPCSQKAEVAKSEYSYKELQTNAPEGVYREAGSIPSSTSPRWIRIESVLLFHSRVSNILETSKGAIGPFVRTDEIVCFEVREKP